MLDDEILAFDLALLLQTLFDPFFARLESGRPSSECQDSNATYLPRLLPLGDERRGEEGTSQGSEEHPPVHHSITWSARCRRDGGMVRPRALAVLRLMTRSNFVGCSMGRSPGRAPLRTLSTNVAARRYISAGSGA